MTYSMWHYQTCIQQYHALLGMTTNYHVEAFVTYDLQGRQEHMHVRRNNYEITPIAIPDQSNRPMT